MRTALSPDGTRIAAQRSGARGRCPGCNGEVVARCGTVLTWHWAHLGQRFCDWYASETDWHLGWKAEAPPDRQEQVIGTHRADIVTPTGVVVELQHSHLSELDIRDRETAYRRMVWLFDGRHAKAEDRLTLRMLPDRHPDEDLHRIIHWTYAPAYTDQVTAPLFVDLGDDTVLWVGGWHQYHPLRGHGWAVTRDWFATTIINGTYWPVPPAGSVPLTTRRLKRHTQRTPDQRIHLDWGKHSVGPLRPCRLCQQPAYLRDADGAPCHKVCAEDLAWLDSDTEGQ